MSFEGHVQNGVVVLDNGQALPDGTRVEVIVREPSVSNGASVSPTARQAARTRFERHFGEVNLGAPTGADNDGIDADLAREYAQMHEGE